MGCILCQPPPLHKLQICGRGCNGESCDPCRELDALQARISKAQQDLREAEKVLASLFAQQHDLQEDVNRCHDPVCRQLPPEIVSSIFQLYIPESKLDNDPSPPKPAMEAVKARFTLGTVCRNWRRIALSTPHLWNLVLVQLHTSDLDLYSDFIQKWLQRSGQLPLDIVVYCRNGFFVSSEGDVNCPKSTRVKLGLLVKMIRLESGRWQTLDLRVPRSFTVSFFSNLPELPSTLQTLRLEADLNDTLGGFVGLPSNMPGLRSVILHRWILSTVRDIQWSNIIHFEATMCLGTRDCIEILKNAPRLRQCRINRAESSHLEPADVLVHHHLEVLELQSECLEIGDRFFDHLELPALRTLKLKSKTSTYFDAQRLVSFLVRSSCPLEIFSIIKKRITLTELSCILRTIPSLTELYLSPKRSRSDASISPDQFFDLLARTSVREGDDWRGLIQNGQECLLLANLQTLHYTFSQPFSFDLVPPVFGPISEFTDNPLRRPLKALHLHIGPNFASCYDVPPISEESATHLAAALEAGLELKVYPVTFRKGLEVAMNRPGVLGIS
ncbi:hypothetical protein CVT26_005794 [Gymnopilus dilepis]|uniref:Uncharacterized protein n=1 Tax=Gymnopilus dilepis TaxID=231916 RepID=A0A409YME2_9AGAR|nr:hypothetical protein CVT26_005794 [Gymnopilus dilepis]